MIEEYPMGKVAREDMLFEFKCVVAAPVVRYMQNTLGEERARSIVTSTSMNWDYLTNPNNWISFDYFCRLLKSMVAETGDPMSPFIASKTCTDPKAYKAIGLVITKLGTPATLYRLVTQFNYLWDKVCKWRMLEHKQNSCKVEVIYKNHKQDLNNCLVIQGCLAASPTFFGLPPAEVSHTECATEAGSSCIYDITWASKPARINSLIGLVAGVVFGLIIVAILWPAGPASWIILFLCALTGQFAGRLLDYKEELARQYGHTEAQLETILETNTAIEKLNQELQLMVEERTEELTKANERLKRALIEQKKSEEHAIKAERQAAIGVLAAGMAHEINNPVNAIRLSIQTLLKKTDKDSKSLVLLENAEKATVRCARIINDLLTFARNNERISAVDLKEVLQKSVNVFRAEQQNSIEINLDIEKDLPVVNVDSGQMQQAFINLMMNAGDAMQGKGNIDISYRREGDNIHIDHKDTGPGISEELQARIFDPFFSTKRDGSSKGLGLAITAELVHRNGGHIKVSSSPDAGACFTLTFPITSTNTDNTDFYEKNTNGVLNEREIRN
ncbi:hypothetical protein BVX97_03010 [bacterium E08(2017)]|nr:hypothetical protein BVX97_03010 [bacterium E08(2017)]